VASNVLEYVDMLRSLVLASLLVGCGSYLQIDANITVPQGIQSQLQYPSLLLFNYADVNDPTRPEGASTADNSAGGELVAVLCQASNTIIGDGQLYAAPAKSNPTPVIAWIAPKPATVTADCGLIDRNAQQDVTATFDDTMPVATIVANENGDGKDEQRAVTIDLVLQ
jgi:hypothetical protein